MARLRLLLVFLLFGFAPLSAQEAPTASLTTTPVTDSQALVLARQSLAAMTGGAPVTDATLSGTATRTAGSDEETGQVLLEAKRTEESKIALTLSTSTYTKVQSFSDISPKRSYINSDSTIHTIALHNCLSSTTYFLPLLSALPSAISDSDTNLSNINQKTLNKEAVQHVRSCLSMSSPHTTTIQSITHLSAVHIYIDSATDLPVAIGFTTHPNNNSSIDIAVGVLFSNYEEKTRSSCPYTSNYISTTA